MTLIARGQFTLYETTDAYSARIDPPVWQTLCDAAGTPEPGELGQGGRATFMVAASRGDRELEPACTSQPATEGRCHWRVVSAVGCTAANQGQDGLVITTLSADSASVALAFDFEGRERQTRSLQITKQRPGQDGAAGERAHYILLHAGYSTGSYVKVDGGASLFPNRRGFNVALIDRKTLALVEYTSYDTYANYDTTLPAMAEYLASVDDDDVFLAVVTYDYVRWTDDIITQLRRFGLGPMENRLTGYYPFAFLGQAGLPQGYAHQAQVESTRSEVGASRWIEFSVYTAGGAMAYAPAGRKGAMPRLRGEWKASETYRNQQDYVDIVLFDGDYYQCTSPAGAVTSSTNPKADTGNWQPFNEFDNLATGVLLAGKGLIRVLGAGRAFIGQTETGEGWEMTRGQIRHTLTGLTLTADGHLQVPNPGALTIEGGTTLEAPGRNLLKNSRYERTSTEYLVQSCPTYEPLVVGERYTLVLRVDLAGTAAGLGVWDLGGMGCMTKDVVPDADGVAVAYLTFRHSSGSLDGIRLYQLNASGNSSAGSEVTLHWAMLLPGWALPRREWYPAPEEDAAQQLDSYKTEVATEFEVMNDSIAAKVSQTDFNALAQRVGTTESQITQQAGLISQKVAQTTFETFKTQTNQSISEVRQTASGIQSTVASHTTQLTRLSTDLDTAQQTAGAAQTAADAATTIRDTRNDDQPPEWYLENYGRKVIREFKLTETIGLKAAFPDVVTEGFCTLETYTQWGDKSGGYPRQTAYAQGRLFTRYGTSEAAWSVWRDTTTRLEVETAVEQGADRLWLGVTSNLLNLFRDGSFEHDVNTVPNTDAGSSAVSFPAWRDIYEPYDGTTSGQWRDVMPQSARVMAIRNWASGAARVILGQHVPVEPGKTYTIILWRHDGGRRTAQDGVRWLNVRTPSSSPTWTSVELADQQPSWTYGWHRECFVVGPAPAAAQSLQVFLGTASSTEAAWTLLDGMMVVEGDLRTAGLVPETFVGDLRSDFSDALYETGINIATGEVTVQADRFRVRGQNGGAGDLLFDTATGLLRTELIDASTLTVRNLDAGRGTIDFLSAPESGAGGMGVYIGRGAFAEALSSTADFTRTLGASLSKTFAHATGTTGAVNSPLTDYALYTVTAGASKAATVRISGSVRVDLAATGHLHSSAFAQGAVIEQAWGSVSAALVLVVDGTTQKFISNTLRRAAPTWDSTYKGGAYVLSNPQNTASASFTVQVDETVYIPAGSQAKIVLRYSYRLDRQSSSFTANAQITVSQASNTLTATVQTRMAALCADGLMLQQSTANSLRLVPGTYSSASDGFRLEGDRPLQLATPVALNRLSSKTITTAMTGVGGNSSDIAFWAGYSLFVFDRPSGERFMLPDVNISPLVNHFRVYTVAQAKLTTQGTGTMGGFANGMAEYATVAGRMFTLDYIEETKMWIVSQ